MAGAPAPLRNNGYPRCRTSLARASFGTAIDDQTRASALVYIHCERRRVVCHTMYVRASSEMWDAQSLPAVLCKKQRAQTLFGNLPCTHLGSMDLFRNRGRNTATSWVGAGDRPTVIATCPCLRLHAPPVVTRKALPRARWSRRIWATKELGRKLNVANSLHGIGNNSTVQTRLLLCVQFDTYRTRKVATKAGSLA